MNANTLEERDYSLFGEDGRRAVEKGLAAAKMYHTEVPGKEIKKLLQLSDSPAIWDNALWVGLMILFAGIGSYLWPAFWSAPFWLACGVLYGSASDSCWHECGHGTAFKTDWMKEVIHQIACFMIMRNPTTWRWSHTRHHMDSTIVGRDPETAVMRPPETLRSGMNFFSLFDAWNAMKPMLLNASGRLSPEEATCIPDDEAGKVYAVARVWVAIFLAAIGLAIWYSSLLPLMIVGLPCLYRAWHHILTGAVQNCGLADIVLDHRFNTRTVYPNPVSRFIYLNMNYPVKHHMSPMVPYHALPRIHRMIAHDLPAPNTSIWQAFAEARPIVRRRLRYEDVFLERQLQASARPCRPHLHDLAAAM